MTPPASLPPRPGRAGSPVPTTRRWGSGRSPPDRKPRSRAGVRLEEVILRHALGLSLDELHRETAAAGVMMLPVPNAGVLRSVDGQDAARSVEGVVGLEITVVAGRRVVPLPEGDRYL